MTLSIIWRIIQIEEGVRPRRITHCEICIMPHRIHYYHSLKIIHTPEHPYLYRCWGTVKRRQQKNVQLVLQQCCKKSWIELLPVLPCTLENKPCNLFRWKTGSIVGGKTHNIAIQLVCNNVAKQVARFLFYFIFFSFCPFYSNFRFPSSCFVPR